MQHKPLRIYVAGPYTAPDPELNTKKAIDAALLVLRKGHFPFIPHLTHYVDLRSREIGTPLSYDDYIRWDLQWLAVCDALLFLGHSKGAALELEKARSLGLRIFHSVDDVPVASEAA